MSDAECSEDENYHSQGMHQSTVIYRLDGTLHVYNYDDILLSSQVKFNWSSIE